MSFDISIHTKVKYLSRRDEVGQVQIQLMLWNGRKKTVGKSALFTTRIPKQHALKVEMLFVLASGLLVPPTLIRSQVSNRLNSPRFHLAFPNFIIYYAIHKRAPRHSPLNAYFRSQHFYSLSFLNSLSFPSLSPVQWSSDDQFSLNFVRLFMNLRSVQSSFFKSSQVHS